MRTLLICHHDSDIDREGLKNWLSSFSDLAGVVILSENNRPKFNRIKREMGRVGFIRFLDVACFRLYYRLFLSSSDSNWEKEELAKIRRKYGEADDRRVRTLVTHSPNSVEAENFIRDLQPDVVIARCKVILKKRIFSLAKAATLVMHPGICPEYRNAHGCFWALAQGDVGNVGMTLLQIDEGIDTGPVFGYYTYDFDSSNESHIRIQTRVVTENFDKIETKIREISEGKAGRIEVEGRPSDVWGHPWLTKYIAWKIRARRNGK
jgi:folate-dependent phosphoribosylglycinamide formyltransferase PurN